jgi:YHS domain-containing protein
VVAEHHGKEEAARAANAKPTAPSAFDQMPALGTKAFCPVSHEAFTVTAKTASSTWKGKTYVFCCPECKPEFDQHPEKFAAQN